MTTYQFNVSDLFHVCRIIHIIQPYLFFARRINSNEERIQPTDDKEQPEDEPLVMST